MVYSVPIEFFELFLTEKKKNERKWEKIKTKTRLNNLQEIIGLGDRRVCLLDVKKV